jgi:hypothetical protein
MTPTPSQRALLYGLLKNPLQTGPYIFGRHNAAVRRRVVQYGWVDYGPLGDTGRQGYRLTEAGRALLTEELPAK